MITGRRIWVTGPEGSGKTTFACHLIKSYRSRRFVVMRLRPDRAARTLGTKAQRLEKKAYYRAGAEEVEILTPPPERIQKALETYMLRFYLFEDKRCMLFEGERVGDCICCDVTVFVTPVLSKGKDPYALTPPKVPGFKSRLEIEGEDREKFDEVVWEGDEEEGKIIAEVNEEEAKQLALELGGMILENQPLPGYEVLPRAKTILINRRIDDPEEDQAYTLCRIEKMLADQWQRRASIHVCDLSNPKNTEFKRAIARVKRLL